MLGRNLAAKITFESFVGAPILIFPFLSYLSVLRNEHRPFLFPILSPFFSLFRYLLTYFSLVFPLARVTPRCCCMRVFFPFFLAAKRASSVLDSLFFPDFVQYIVLFLVGSSLNSLTAILFPILLFILHILRWISSARVVFTFIRASPI